jgi:DNA-binding transcriptional ArsR family regulator
MPTAEYRLETLNGPTVAPFVVSPSLAVDVMWATLWKPAGQDDGDRARQDRFEEEPELPDRIGAMWDDGEACFTEIVLLADRAGVLFVQDPEQLWRGLSEAAALPPRYEPLTSETDEDQIRFRQRLERLHEDADLRQRWLQLLRAVWDAIAPAYARHGAEAAASDARRYQARLPAAGTYSDLAPMVADHCDVHGLLPRLVADAADAGQEVLIVPSWIARKAYVLTLPDRLLWSPSVPARPVGPTEDTRRRARLYKALGDPTRLAIFEATGRRPRTVGELAAELGVSQPTISNHVRILRDAGLLIQDRGDGRRLTPDSAAFERFLRDAGRALLPIRIVSTVLERPFERGGLG